MGIVIIIDDQFVGWVFYGLIKVPIYKSSMNGVNIKTFFYHFHQL
jgi:hypothetical protein